MTPILAVDGEWVTFRAEVAPTVAPDDEWIEYVRGNED